MEFKYHKLDNGLQIVAEVNPYAFSASIGYFVLAGARDETPELSGVSHFLEHMMFKGSEHLSADEVNRALDDLGSQSNAYTSEEQTTYYMSVLPELVGQGVELLTEMMRPALRDSDFETERHVIIEEIAMYDDQPPYGGMERLSEIFFEQHPLAGRVLGTKGSVSNLNAGAMRDYFLSRYSPNNICFVATGKVDFERMVEQLAKLTEDWKPIACSRPDQVLKVQAKSEQMIHPPSAQQYVLQFAPGVTRLDSRKYAVRLMASILGDDTGSRLYWELIDSGKAEAAVLFTQEYQDCGLVGAYMACPPQQAVKNWREFGKVVESSLKKKPFGQEELDRAVNKVCSGLAIGAEKPANRLFTVGNAWLYRQKYEPSEQVLKQYRQVTLADIQRELEQWLTAPKVSLGVGPKDIRGLFG